MVIGGGARPLGMGRAFVAIADDADALFINPAGIAGLKGPQGMTMFTNLMGDVYYSEFCGAIPASFGTVGVGYIMTGVNQIPVTGTTSEVNTDYYDTALVFSYSTPLARFLGYAKNIFVGANYKIFNRGFTGGVNQFSTGVSMDFGIKYVASPNLSLGLSRQNILPVSMGGFIRLSSGAEESISSITKIGLAVKPVPLKENVLVAMDIDLPAQSGRPVTMHLGAEWKMNKYLTFRGGLDQSVDAAAASKTSWNPTSGISFGYAGFRVDYAYHAYYNDPSLATTYVSLSLAGEPWLALKGGPAYLPEGSGR
jgi:hypothetical protein